MSEIAEQGSADWLYARCGLVTGSRFKDILAVKKDGSPTAAYESYLWEIVCERLTGIPTEHYVTAAMQTGTDREPMARMQYEAATGRIVSEVGLIHHPTLKGVAGSCDGLVDEEGMIEIKCPTTPTHLRTILDATCEHLPQIQGYLWITGRQWCDFVSYDPALTSAGLALYIQRVARDDGYIANLAGKVTEFLCNVDNLVAELKAKSSPPKPTDFSYLDQPLAL